jgi:hypothetical protein
MGATFYVSTTGSDSNPGTPAAPWRTIQKAFNTLTAGQGPRFAPERTRTTRA